MRIGIMGNTDSERTPGRIDLSNSLIAQGCSVYFFGVLGKSINKYYCDSDHVQFVPIKASRNNMNPIKEIFSIFNIRDNIRKQRIDAVIIYGVKNHIAMAIGAKLGKCKRIICVVNGRGNLFTLSGLKGRIVRFMSFPMLKIAYAISSFVCFQNLDDRNLFQKKKLVTNDKKIFVTAGSGVNIDDYEYSPINTKENFLFLSRITPTKGIHEYIKAAELVKNIYPEVTFDVVGPIDTAVEEDNYKEMEDAEKKGIIVYHGATDDVFSWIKNCRYFVYPSYYPEGIPRCVLQALSVGRPIITCNTPGCKETVIDGVNGFLVPPCNVDLLAEKMIWMIEHPQEIAKMSKKSREYAEAKFDVNQINKVIIDKLLT